MDFKNINHINIKVGDRCNLACKYCIQESNKARKEDMPSVINSNLYNIVKRICSNGHKLNINFSGGEPLLYLEQIKKIVDNTKQYNIGYIIETNGVLLTKEIVAFLNNYDFVVNLSWDGRNSLAIRGFDVFSNPNLKELIFKINKLNICGLITSQSYPLQLSNDIQMIVDQYKTTNTGGIINTYIGEIQDFCLKDREILDINYDEVSNDIRQMTTSTDSEVARNFLQSYKFREILKHQLFYQRNYDSIFMDLSGTLFPNITSRVMIGGLKDIKNYDIKSREFNRNLDVNNKVCENCKLQSMCTNRMRLMYIASIGGDISKTCKLKAAIYQGLQKD